jgi:hypothetical protein
MEFMREFPDDDACLEWLGRNTWLHLWFVRVIASACECGRRGRLSGGEYRDGSHLRQRTLLRKAVQRPRQRIRVVGRHLS